MIRAAIYAFLIGFIIYSFFETISAERNDLYYRGGPSE